MTKKEYILKLLISLESSWPMASGLRILVESSVLDDQTMSALFEIFRHAVSTVVGEQEKEKLQKGLGFLEKLKSTEMNAKKQDDKDLQELDSLLETL